MIDTHCHLDLLSKEDFEETINDKRFEYLITVGYDKKTIENALNIANKYDHVYCAIGYHPHDVENITEKDIEELYSLAKSNEKVKAIGEIGLDYYREGYNKEKQQEFFRVQINVAKKLGLPIIVHSREAEEDSIKILKEEKAYEISGIIHCFTGSESFMKEAVDLGFYISYAGVLTFKNAESLREVFKKTPTKRILIETDAPYLAPVPYRGKPNKPAYIFETAKVMASLLPNSSLEDIERMTSENAKLCLNLGFKKSNTITYVINKKIYINPTNKCNLHCEFCERERSQNYMTKGYWVWVDKDPTPQQVINELKKYDLKEYKEIVFCGYGEPMLRIDLIKEVGNWVKSIDKDMPIRVDTNGLYFLFGKKEDLQKLKGIVDTFSVSLNAQDKETYNKICHPSSEKAFDYLIDFIKALKELNFNVITTAVNYKDVDIEKTEKLAKELGTSFRKREYEIVG